MSEYTLEELLYKTPTAEVHKARARTGEIVAYKHFKAGGMGDEAGKAEVCMYEQLRKVSTPHLLQMRKAFREKGRRVLVLNYVKGTDLRRAIIDREKIHPPTEEDIGIALYVGIQACEAIATLHKPRYRHNGKHTGILHCDLKPGNLMLDQRGRVVLIDLSAAVYAEEVKCQQDTAAGTFDFMSPEQWQFRPLSRRTDVWGLGVTLYSIATQAYPFSEKNTKRLEKQICEEEPFPLAVINETADAFPLFRRVIQTAMQKMPRDRYSDISSMRRALVHAYDEYCSLHKPMTRERVCQQIPALQENATTITSSARPVAPQYSTP